MSSLLAVSLVAGGAASFPSLVLSPSLCFLLSLPSPQVSACLMNLILKSLKVWRDFHSLHSVAPAVLRLSVTDLRGGDAEGDRTEDGKHKSLGRLS